MRLTPPDDSGVRWSPDRTVQVVPRYADTRSYDQRNRPIGHDVIGVMEYSLTRVRTLPEATEVAAALVAARPALDWSAWTGDPDAPWRRGHPTTLQCTATSPRVGLVLAWASLAQSREYPGMWAVGYTMEGWNAHWLCKVRHIPHRLAFVRAQAIWRTYNLGEPLE